MTAARPRGSFLEVFLRFLRLGATVFGGVGPQLDWIRRELVEKDRWLDAADLKRGVALGYLCPGPVGFQAGVYAGWRRAGVPGSIAAGLGLVLPAFVLIVAIAEARARFAGASWLDAAAAGARAAVVPIVAISSWRLARSSLETRLERWLAATAAALCLFQPDWAMTAVLAAGIASAAASLRRRGAASVALFPVFMIGFQAGLLVYGTGQAILPIVRQHVVLQNAWLTDAQFADAFSAGLITPGPVVIALAYVGHLLGGVQGAIAASLGVFLPAWGLVLLVGPLMEKVEKRSSLAGFARGATAGAIGGVAAAAVGLGQTALTGPSAWAVAAAAAAAVLSRRVPDALTIAAAAVCFGLL